jgi:diketogulonate reductase-like aldo/keto reductase
MRSGEAYERDLHVNRTAADADSAITMPKRKFGPTSAAVAVIGQGTWMIEGDYDAERRAVAALRVGLELGMTHVDTAEMYGNGRAEELIGEAIAGRREEIFLAGKVLPSNASYEGTLKACARSLKRLKTDWLDLYMLHWPSDRYPIRETMRAMEKLVSEGLVRFVGVSNFDVEELTEAEAALRNEPMACDQVLYHLRDRGIERSLIPHCARREIAVVGYAPFGHGDFPSPESRGGRVLAEIGKRHGRTARQVALNFLTRHSNVFTIPKAARPEHVRENAGGAGWKLTAEELAAIDRAFPAPDHDVPLGVI